MLKLRMLSCLMRNSMSVSGRNSPSYCYHRCLCVSVNRESKKRKSDELKIISRPPSKAEYDLIGPADSESNIRPTIYYIPPSDTHLEQDFRKRRQQVYQWNHDFWAQHNIKFANEKKRFTEAKLFHLGEYHDDGTKRTLTAEEMSEFYKRFLEENFELMENYHREWYRKNNSLTFRYLRVYLQRFLMALKRTIVRR